MMYIAYGLFFLIGLIRFVFVIRQFAKGTVDSAGRAVFSLIMGIIMMVIGGFLIYAKWRYNF